MVTVTNESPSSPMIVSTAKDITDTPFPFSNPCNEEEKNSLVEQQEKVDESLQKVESALVQEKNVIGNNQQNL